MAVSNVQGSITELQYRDRCFNHALAEGHSFDRPTTEREIIQRNLRQSRERRYYAPNKHDFIDDFMFKMDDSFDHHKQLFNQ